MMNHAPEYIRTMRSLEPLLRGSKQFLFWEFDAICDWLSFFWNRGTISFVIDDEGRAHGVCTIKLFRNLGQFLEPFVHDPCGRFVMIEVLIADSPEVMAELCDELTDRWGKQAIVMWDRGERTESGAPRMFRWHQFQRLARRMTTGFAMMNEAKFCKEPLPPERIDLLRAG